MRGGGGGEGEGDGGWRKGREGGARLQLLFDISPPLRASRRPPTLVAEDALRPHTLVA